MELRHLRYVLAVADEGNFTRAAARLGIAQPPLSQQVRSLEDELGVQLFHRVSHGAELTAAGAAFVDEARLAVAAAERARLAAERAHRGETGRLLLGFTPSAAFNPSISGAVDAFHERWPAVRLSLEELNTTALYQRLGRGDLDAAFVRPAADVPAGIRLRPLPDEAMVVALPVNHRLAAAAGDAKLRLADLARESFILFPREIGPSLRDAIFAACQASGFTPDVTEEAQRVTSTVNLVAAHLGISVVPASIAQIRLPGVVYREIEPPVPMARLALGTAKGSRSPITRNFLDLLP